MRTPVIIAAVLAIGFSGTSVSQASEVDFLKRFEGSWGGGGSVRLRADAPARKVTCSLKADAKAATLSIRGVCRALVVASRRIAAKIEAEGTRYSGTYVGPEGKTSLLSGRRSGETLNLAVRWAKEVNGDRKARMEIASLANGRMRLRTIDADPNTGTTILTSNIELVRD